VKLNDACDAIQPIGSLATFCGRGAADAEPTSIPIFFDRFMICLDMLATVSSGDLRWRSINPAFEREEARQSADAKTRSHGLAMSHARPK
jgi:hypothetical protein